VTFLLAVAVADDFVGMGVIALFYPQQTFDWFGVVVLAAGMSTAFAMSRLATGRIQLLRNWQFFLVPAAICWLGLHLAGLHSALAMVFVVPFIPMAGRDVGIFAEQQSTALWLPHRFLRLDRGTDIANRPDRSTLDPINRFDLAVRPWVDTGLFFFGLANAGVAWYGSNAWNQNSWAVFLGLGIGKTLGIGVMTALGYVFVRLLLRRKSTPIGLEVVQLLKWRDVPLVGLLGAMGFTVALFVADAAGAAPSLKLGAMASFVYLGIAVLVGRQIVPPKDRQELPLVAAPLNRDPQDTEISADEKRSGGEGTNVARAQTARYKKLAITNPFRISCLIVWMTRST